jgi:tRNA(Arg) A34 adenosine deaminase TadA
LKLLNRSLFIALGLCPLLSTSVIADGPSQSGHGTHPRTDFEEYMATRGRDDPDPTMHMQALIEYTKESRRAAVKYCAEQEPPKLAKDCPGGVPFCALIVDRRSDQVIAKACNHGGSNPVFHGEIAAINLFAIVLQSRGMSFSEVAPYHDLYTTGESCAMCMGAIMWSDFHTVFFGSNLEFLGDFYSQIMIRDRELTGLWRECQAKENTVRTLVVGGVLEKENNVLFEEFGFQFCPAASAHASGPESSQ